jgi:hypothetical protein
VGNIVYADVIYFDVMSDEGDRYATVLWDDQSGSNDSTPVAVLGSGSVTDAVSEGPYRQLLGFWEQHGNSPLTH